MLEKFIEKFKSESIIRKIILTVAVIYITGIFISEFINNGSIERLIPYLVTYTVKIAIILSAVKAVRAILEKINKKNDK